MDLALDRLAGHRVVVDLDLAAVLVETVDLVAVALGDLELVDAVALLLELGLELVGVLPGAAFGGGALGFGEGAGAAEDQGKGDQDVAHGGKLRCMGWKPQCATRS